MRRRWLFALVLWALACSGGEGPPDTGAEPTVTAAPEPPPEPESPAPDASTSDADADADPPVAAEVGFLGEPDGAVRASLAALEPTEIERGSGGRSLGFKITLSDGTKGYFKPEQSFSAAHWYSEVAAYYLDRALGFGRVAPVVGRRMAWEPLRRAARGDERISEISVAEDGTVRGAFVGWVSGGLGRLSLGDGWEKWVRVQGRMEITPYVRPVDWRNAIRRNPGDEEDGGDRGRDPDGPRRDAGEPDTPDRAAELSDLIVFDFLVSNVDRWGGGFTNVRTRGQSGPLLFFDNGAGFWLGRNRLGLMDARLRAVQRFRRSTVRALERFELRDFEARLASDPLAPVLNAHQIEGVEERRRAVLEHVAELRARFGDDEVLAF